MKRIRVWVKWWAILRSCGYGRSRTLWKIFQAQVAGRVDLSDCPIWTDVIE